MTASLLFLLQEPTAASVSNLNSNRAKCIFDTRQVTLSWKSLSTSALSAWWFLVAVGTYWSEISSAKQSRDTGKHQIRYQLNCHSLCSFGNSPLRYTAINGQGGCPHRPGDWLSNSQKQCYAGCQRKQVFLFSLRHVSGVPVGPARPNDLASWTRSQQSKKKKNDLPVWGGFSSSSYVSFGCGVRNTRICPHMHGFLFGLSFSKKQEHIHALV